MIDELGLRRRKLIKDIIDNPLFPDVLNEVQAQILYDLTKTEPNEALKRETLYLEIKALERIVGKLQSYANDYTAEVGDN